MKKIISDEKLYRQVLKNAKKRFKIWPSAYASGYVVKEYKRRGGTFNTKKTTSELNRWFKEQWIDVCDGSICARENSNEKYPYCRPSKKINSKTPKLASSFTTKEIKKLCKTKRKKQAKNETKSPVYIKHKDIV